MPRKKKVSKSESVTPTDASVSAVTEPDTGDDQLSDLPQTRPLIQDTSYSTEPEA